MLLFSWRRARARPLLEPGAVGLAALAFGVLGLGWFVAVYLRLGAEPLRYFFLRENLQRFAGATYDSGQPFWYYPATYLAQGLPWSLFLPLAIWNAARPAATGAAEDVARRAHIRWLLGWAGLMAVPLSLSRGKIDYYLLPLYPVLALAIGAQLGQAWGRRERAWARTVSALCAALLAAVPLVVGVFPPEWLPAPSLLLPLVLLPALAALANAAVSADVGRERAYRPEVTVAVCEDEARVQRAILFEARVPVQQQCD